MVQANSASLNTIDEYRLCKTLGSGVTSTVYLAQKTMQDMEDQAQDELAIKVLKFDNDAEKNKAMNYLMKELEPLRGAVHEHVV